MHQYTSAPRQVRVHTMSLHARSRDFVSYRHRVENQRIPSKRKNDAAAGGGRAACCMRVALTSVCTAPCPVVAAAATTKRADRIDIVHRTTGSTATGLRSEPNEFSPRLIRPLRTRWCSQNPVMPRDARCSGGSTRGDEQELKRTGGEKICGRTGTVPGLKCTAPPGPELAYECPTFSQTDP